MRTSMRSLALILLALAALAALPHRGAAATITIVNADTSGEGFNDPTAAAPVGGNPGTTIGQQRLNVFQHAADVWGAILPSTIQIRVLASFDPLSCNATSAVLGSAGTRTVHRDFTNAEFATTWYPQALANKEAGTDLAATTDDIRAQFNRNVGNTGCLTGITWYYGFDNNEGASQVDLLPVVIHELGHGLGFATFVTLSTGAQFSGFPDVFERFLVDDATGKRWTAMTDGERAASAINGPHVVWDGTAATFMAPLILSPRPVMNVTAPAGIAGSYPIGQASFGAPLTTTAVSGTVVLADDGAAPGSDACTALVNGGAMNGHIALIDRGVCGFAVKAKNAQNAGAIAVIIADNVAASTPPGLGGSDPTVTIPTVSVTLAVGNTLKANLAGGVSVSLLLDPAQLAGANAAHHPLMYAPNPLQLGSSISHWDVSATPNLLMEPAINPDLTTNVDLTRYAFEDIGWLPRTTSVPAVAGGGAALATGMPNPFTGSTTIRFRLAAAGPTELAVFDLGGRIVKRLARGTWTAGDHSVVWDGTDESGRRLPPGVYAYHLHSGALSESRHIVLFR